MPHYHGLATRMSRALILQQVTFRELYHTSRALGPGSIDQAMDNRTEADLEALEANLARTREMRHDAPAVAELDAEFHKLLDAATHNRVLQLAKEPVSILVRPTTAHIITNNPGGIPRLIEAHTHIVDALRDAIARRAGCGSTATCATGRPDSSASGRDLDSPVDARPPTRRPSRLKRKCR